MLAFAGIAQSVSARHATPPNPLAPKDPHFAPRAKTVIFLCMSGGPSHLDMFDYKPKLVADDGTPPSMWRPCDPAQRQLLPAAEICAGPVVAPDASQPSRGRGQYDRASGKGSRVAWLPHVQQFVQALDSGNLSTIIGGAICPQEAEGKGHPRARTSTRKLPAWLRCA